MSDDTSVRKTENGLQVSRQFQGPVLCPIGVAVQCQESLQFGEIVSARNGCLK